MIDKITKDIADMLFEKANIEYNELHNKRHLMVRWGQTLWNTVEEYISENGSNKLKDYLNSLKGTINDCYYNDERTSNFMNTLVNGN